MFPKYREDLSQMLHVFFPRLAIDQDVIHENQHIFSEERGKNFIHDSLEVADAFVRPKGMTLNSQWPL